MATHYGGDEISEGEGGETASSGYSPIESMKYQYFIDSG